MRSFPIKYSLWVLGSAAFFLLLSGDVFGSNIRDTKHNLSSLGPGQIKAGSEKGVCIFCHTTKRARRNIPFRWNRENPNVNYTPYKSSTLQSSVGQPTGSSRVCLSCHDGTIALGAVVSKKSEVHFKGGIRVIPAQRPTRLGTDLSDDHPVSFVYSTQLASLKALVSPAQLPSKVKLDGNRELQCTTCHDPHDDTFGKFLVMSNQYSALCTTCHDIRGWAASSHSLSYARWNGQGADPWPNTPYQTVAENGCEGCHRPHSAEKHERLLKHSFEEDNCLACHNGNVASKNIEQGLTRPFAHRVQNYTNVHNAAENFNTRNVNKHVECEDCHNPHKSNKNRSSNVLVISGTNEGVTGINAGGQQVRTAESLYEICFKCHADNNVYGRFPITRQLDQLNTRLEFNPGNPSFHPVESPGMNQDVPSLLASFTPSSMISCIDCHNTDNPDGPKGPHGSIYNYLLERNYVTYDYTFESSDNYALCYKCHSRSSLLSDQSFSEHQKHIVDQRTPCSVCHDPHGINQLQGNSQNNSHLINFDLEVVRKNASGSLYFEDDGRFRGQCFLNCHGAEHDPKKYPEGFFP
jgi:predicted CXXCH cytochrome family protein